MKCKNPRNLNYKSLYFGRRNEKVHIIKIKHAIETMGKLKHRNLQARNKYVVTIFESPRYCVL